MSELELGSILGDYRIIGILGAGGMGKVYKVKNLISDRVEAMKVLLPNLVSEAELADRFMREIKVQASLEHPNIAALHTALRIDNQLLMLMELVDGETLEQVLARGPLPVAQALDYTSQALAALGYAHQHGVIHRDIKPANMMLTPNGAIKLMDFGIAKAANDRRLTMTGFTMGSLYYMSPEQIAGASTLDARSDLYSLGVSLYELVTGKRPFDGDSQYSIMSAHLEKNPAPPITLDPKLPPRLSDIILKSLTKEAAGRFQTAEEFRAALGEVVAARPPVAAPGPAPMPAAPMPAAPMAIDAAVSPRVGQRAAAGAAQGPQGEFRLIEPTKPDGPKGRRMLWMAAGGLAAALAIVAVVQFGPWKSTGASSPPAATPAPVTTPAAALPVPAPAANSQPAVETPTSAVTAPPSPTQAAPKPAATNAGTASAPPSSPGRTVPVRTAPVRTESPAPRNIPAAMPAVTAPPAAQPAAPQVVELKPPAAAPREDPARRAELQQVREQLAMLGARAGACNDGLNSLARSQAASGLGLRGDMTEAANLMNSFLNGSRQALNAGDAPAAKSLMEKAERQVEKIEKFLGR